MPNQNSPRWNKGTFFQLEKWSKSYHFSNKYLSISLCHVKTSWVFPCEFLGFIMSPSRALGCNRNVSKGRVKRAAFKTHMLRAAAHASEEEHQWQVYLGRIRPCESRRTHIVLAVRLTDGCMSFILWPCLMELHFKSQTYDKNLYLNQKPGDSCDQSVSIDRYVFNHFTIGLILMLCLWNYR